MATGIDQLHFRSLRESYSGKKQEKKKKAEESDQVVSPQAPENTFLSLQPAGQTFEVSPLTDDGQRRSLQELYDTIQESSNQLLRNPSNANVKEYRQAIMRFIRHVNDSASVMEESYGMRSLNDGSRKKYTIIRVINEKLNNLAAAILREQRESLDLLHRLNEINGLIIDLKG